MSLIDNSTDYSGVNPWGTRQFTLVYEIDFSVTANNMAQNDVMVLADDLPLGLQINGIIIEVTTAQATITDIDVGLDSTATHVTSDNLIDGASLAATGWV